MLGTHLELVKRIYDDSNTLIKEEIIDGYASGNDSGSPSGILFDDIIPRHSVTYDREYVNNNLELARNDPTDSASIREGGKIIVDHEVGDPTRGEHLIIQPFKNNECS